MIVEGDAENILFPTLARILQRDFTENGVSIVNVGGVGLRRFARIYQRKDPATDGVIPVPVACVTDFDVMPDCAPEITGRIKPNETWPETNKRRWRAKKDYTTEELAAKRDAIRSKASGQQVKTFVADEWTLEYDLAFAGLAREVFVAARLAAKDERIAAGKVKAYVVVRQALRDFADLAHQHPAQDELATSIYEPFINDSDLSKATAAQYLAWILQSRYRRGRMTTEELRAMLPHYIVDAIEHVTLSPAPSNTKEDAPELAVVAE
jgi:putative ATP-dependent endonuclease of OLD family